MKLSLISIALFLGFQIVISQESKKYSFVNPSFEGLPSSGKAPSGWIDCGFSNQTPVDIQPGRFSVETPAKSGKTYLGMVVRDNDTYERVCQRLNFTMIAGDTYKFGVYLAMANKYLSPETITLNVKQVNHNNACKLRVWGSNNYCSKEELLAETGLVNHADWKMYNFACIPNSDYNYIIFEVFYKTPVLNPYNGNILMDALTDIVWVPKVKDIAKVEPPKKKIDKPKETGKTSMDKKPDFVNNRNKILNLDIRNLKKNQVVQVDKLYFNADSSTIELSSNSVLDEIYDFLSNNPLVNIEVGGHTNNIPKDEYCITLSTLRAKAVVDYLVNRGISVSRLSFKGYGKKYPIASNTTPEGRKKNQRVEIKILSING